MLCLNDLTASTSLWPVTPDSACGNDDVAAVTPRRGRTAVGSAFLAALNEGLGEELLDAYHDNRDDRTRNALAMHYALCAQVVARQIYRALSAESRRQVDLADVEQTASHLLFQLVERFDRSLGIPLSAFLTQRLRFALIDEYRRMGLMVRGGRATSGSQSPRWVPLERPGRHRGEAGRMLVVVDRSRGPVQQLMDRESRRELLRRLPRPHRLFVVYRYLRGMPVARVARRLEITAEEANRLHREALAILRESLGARDRGTRRTKGGRRNEASAWPKAARTPGASGPLPVDLQRAKDFRRWFVLRLPWAYRKLIAYRYLRGRDIDWTASKLGMCPNKARLLDRQAQPLMVKAVETYQAEIVRAVA